ncbi:MAG: hypothetical protein ABEJ91_00560 [Candidatus Nanohaloarchaea archaeon]
MSTWDWINDRLGIVEKVPSRTPDQSLVDEWARELGDSEDTGRWPGRAAHDLYLDAVNDGYDEKDAAFNLGLAGMHAYRNSDISSYASWRQGVERGASSAILKFDGENGDELLELVEDGFNQYDRLVDHGYPF